ncbi:MAG: tetratricopeptide repeat protein [Alphaproteobacteria bacterium]|nr:tetratricopeptide repeat protein [Alphaproteobacteria bacterium]
MRRHLLRYAVIGTAALAVSGCAGGPATPPVTKSPTKAVAQTVSTKPRSFPDNLSGEIHRARLLRIHGDYNGALRALAQLMLLSPDNPQVVGEYGKDLVDLGRAKEALAFLDRAIELQPHSWSLLSARGVAQDQLHDTKAAAQSYRAALALSPDQPSILNNYALNQMMRGHKEQAKALFERALARGGKDPRIAQNLVLLNRPTADTGALPPDNSKAVTHAARNEQTLEGPGVSSTPHATTQAKTAVVMEKLPSRPPARTHSGRTPASASQDSKESSSQALASSTPTATTPITIPALRTSDDSY